jgi:hypothetical protein
MLFSPLFVKSRNYYFLTYSLTKHAHVLIALDSTTSPVVNYSISHTDFILSP